MTKIWLKREIASKEITTIVTCGEAYMNKPIYKSLDPTCKQLRFVALLLGSKTAKIKCRLIAGTLGCDRRWYVLKCVRERVVLCGGMCEGSEAKSSEVAGRQC
jgi:hypothetical protein